MKVITFKNDSNNCATITVIEKFNKHSIISDKSYHVRVNSSLEIFHSIQDAVSYLNSKGYYEKNQITNPKDFQSILDNILNK